MQSLMYNNSVIDSHVIIICINDFMWSTVLYSWGTFSKVCGNDNKAADTMVEVEDTEILQDNGVAGKPSDKLEEELTSPKQTAMESVHHEETNIEKASPPHDSTSKGRSLETPAVSFDNVSWSCECINHNCTSNQ